MADRIEAPTITIPPGTTKAVPQLTALSLQDSIVERIQVVIPPGPSGLMGFAFVHSGQQVIPFKDGEWIVVDDQRLDWPIEHFPTGDKWSVKAYNLDVHAHTIYLFLHLREIPIPVVTRIVPVTIVATGAANAEGGRT